MCFIFPVDFFAVKTILLTWQAVTLFKTLSAIQVAVAPQGRKRNVNFCYVLLQKELIAFEVFRLREVS